VEYREPSLFQAEPLILHVFIMADIKMLYSTVKVKENLRLTKVRRLGSKSSVLVLASRAK